MKSKVLENKKIKEEKLMNSALELFSEKDIQDVTIQDIVNKAGVAKGTFYLYFKDKYQIQNALIHKESTKLFKEARNKCNESQITDFIEKTLFMIDQVLLTLESNPFMLRFIKRSLSWGVFQNQINAVMDENEFNILEEFRKDTIASNYHFDNPDITLYLIIEMVGSTCYTSIMYNQPTSIHNLKPYLYDAIRAILQQGKIE